MIAHLVLCFLSFVLGFLVVGVALGFGRTLREMKTGVNVCSFCHAVFDGNDCTEHETAYCANCNRWMLVERTQTSDKLVISCTGCGSERLSLRRTT